MSAPPTAVVLTEVSDELAAELTGYVLKDLTKREADSIRARAQTLWDRLVTKPRASDAAATPSFSRHQENDPAIEGRGRKRVELDAAGQPKLPLTLMESMAVNACNMVKAWAESDRASPFPEKAHMLADGVLMMAAQRREGVQ